MVAAAVFLSSGSVHVTLIAVAVQVVVEVVGVVEIIYSKSV